MKTSAFMYRLIDAGDEDVVQFDFVILDPITVTVRAENLQFRFGIVLPAADVCISMGEDR